MNQIIALICALLWCGNALSQHTALIDSLTDELAVAGEDTFKVEILLRLFSPTVINDPQQAYDYADEALRLSEKLSFDKGIASAYQRKGIFWAYRGNFPKAKENYKKAIEVHKRMDHKVVMATLIYNLALLYQERGIYDSALILNSRAADIFLEHNDSLKYASALDLFSSIYNEKGNYYLNLKYATEAAALFHKYGDELREADNLVKIGQSYAVQGKYRKAIDYYQSAMKIYRKFNDKQWESFAIQTAAIAYMNMGDLARADSANNISMALSDSLGAVHFLAENYALKGDILFEKGEYDGALQYYRKALKTNEQSADSTFIATTTIAMGRCYQKMGKLESAKSAYLSVLPVSLKMNVRENLKTIYKSLSELYEKEGRKSKALHYHKKFIAVNDSITDREKNLQFAEMQAKYDLEKKEREIAMQNQAITILNQKAEISELIRMRLIVSIAVVMLFFIIGIYVLWIRNNRNKLKREIEHDRLTHELDLKQRELTTNALMMIRKNELLENLQNKLSELKKRDINGHNSFHEITRLINTNRRIDKEWENFAAVFEQVHPDFFATLKSMYNKISPNELRMAAMMKMNLNTKEMASILNITPDSVKKARHRLRKKLALEPGANVNDYLMNL